MNWGKGITIALVLFMSFIGSMVYVAFTKNADLVADDYYERELIYDQLKQEKANYKKMGSTISVEKIEDGIAFTYPNVMLPNTVGKIEFYRPDQKKYDREFELKMNSNHVQMLDYTNFYDGYYEFSVSWKDAKEKGYIFESNISF